MADGANFGSDARTSPRFVPKEPLSMFLARGASQLVHGDIKDLSEQGACVRTDAALDSGGVVTIDVRNGYSFLFRAEARIVWRSSVRRPHESFDCTHGIIFTELSPFNRKLIRRLSGNGGPEGRAATNVVEGRVWDSDSDPDLEILFRAQRAPDAVDRSHMALLADPLFEPVQPPLVNSRIEVVETKDPGAATPTSQTSGVDEFLELDDLDLEPLDGAGSPDSSVPARTSGFARDFEAYLDGSAELAGNLGYFDIADILQMLEASRATGVLAIEGPCVGEIQLLEGMIGACFSKGSSEDEAAFRLITSRQGRFHFVPDRILGTVHRTRTTTQLLLEAQLRRDHNDSSRDR